MISTTSLKADFKMMIREPLLILFMFIPIFIFVVFKLLIVFFVPVLYNMTGFNLENYYGYVLSASLLFTPNMLGAVVAFLMIDERDAKIYELMSVTPLGSVGYICNRLVIPFILSIIYTFIGYYILNIFYIPTFTLALISILLGIDSIIIGLLLFTVADDKVKGLTYAKGFGVFTILALIDLLKLPWASFLGALLPFYWVTRLVNDSSNIILVLKSVVIHGLWLFIIINFCRKSNTNSK
ncbi:hypothetical protein GOQ29_05515 [Clostridium sp. D2Q-14]|uniref:hypothetical protein n=1 Tax=Anaeromonas gelatinilytica TaxID=2683194 RepID=UPI00193AE98A|nr:hypothetical protein [Anaeromonas gelatinilytica]MBS4535077.1 hypothetical protein [Anaeromonas gelatinilytica]